MIDHGFTMKELPISERPYEKCEQMGASSLSDGELLAVILKTGTKGKTVTKLANELLLLHPCEEGLVGLAKLDSNDFMKLSGIGRVKAIQLSCIFEISKRLTKSASKGRVLFNEPETIADYYMEELRFLSKEQIIVLYLDSKNQLIRDVHLSQGTVNAAFASPREILLLGLKYEAVHFIMMHNHPSGDPTPSREDILLTKRLKEAGDLLGITLLDHIIIGDLKYCSFCEEGIIWQ